MEISTSYVHSILVISINGKLDPQSVDDAEGIINEIIKKGERRIVFDMQEVKYISSTGLRLFIALMRELRRLRGGMKLANMPLRIRKSFEVIGLLDLLSVYPSVDAAIQSFDNSL